MTKEDALFFLGRFRTEGINEKLYDALGVAIEALNAQTDKRTETHACDLISRQAAIDALYDWSEHSMTDAEAWHLRQVIGDIKSMPSAQQWIPCEERLPEPGVNVLVHVLDIPAGDCFPLVDKIGDDGDWRNCYGDWLAVAWVPIPDPWEGENDG